METGCSKSGQGNLTAATQAPGFSPAQPEERSEVRLAESQSECHDGVCRLGSWKPKTSH